MEPTKVKMSQEDEQFGETLYVYTAEEFAQFTNSTNLWSEPTKDGKGLYFCFDGGIEGTSIHGGIISGTIQQILLQNPKATFDYSIHKVRFSDGKVAYRMQKTGAKKFDSTKHRNLLNM